jgi:hypothetical protein
MKQYEHPIIIYLIVVLVSAVAAIIFYFLGGKAAEVTSAKPFWGFTIKAGGALAGFLIILGVSAYWLERLQKERKKMLYITLYLTNGDDKFPKEIKYNCKYQILDLPTGERTEFIPIDYRWDSDYLTLDIRDISPSNLIAIRIEEIENTHQPNVWETEHLALNSHTIDVKHSRFITGRQR